MRIDRIRPVAPAGLVSLLGMLLSAVGLIAVVPEPGAAQDPAVLCSGEVSTPELAARCADGAVAVDRMRTALSVGHGAGPVVPGSASTLGRRFGGNPRFGLSARVGFTRFDVPTPDRWGSTDEEGVLAATLAASVGVGVLDGFSLAPTVGGVLALDLIADVSTLRLPSDDGFEDASTAWGYGVRIGLLRESFTLPGASVSVMRRSGASSTMTGSAGTLDSDVTTTSIRATVGKDVLAFGLLAGVGWDRADSDWSLEVTDGGPPLQVSMNDDTDTEFTIFGALTRTFLITQLGLEAGWTDELFFGSATFRLIL